MATRTSVTSGKWSAAGTWDTGVPADGDSVVIASGHTVEFDVDQSGFADGIAGITITGTLSLTRTAGTYYLKMKASTAIVGAGTFDCGTQASPIPFAAKHTITGGSGWYVKGNDGAGLTVTLYAAEPTYKYVRLTGAESAGSTRLEVDTDVTGDLWTVGDTVIVVQRDKTRNYEAATIAAINSGYIDISSGLAGSKNASSWIFLITRNLRLIANAATPFQGFTMSKLVIGGGEVQGYGSYGCVSKYMTVSGGVLHGIGLTNAFISETDGYVTVSGGVICALSGWSAMALTYLLVTGGIFAAIGAVGGMACPNQSVSGATFIACTYGIMQQYGQTIENCVFESNVTGIYVSRGVRVKNCSFIYNRDGLSQAHLCYLQDCTFTANTDALVWCRDVFVNDSSFSGNTDAFDTTSFIANRITISGGTENNGYNQWGESGYSESLNHGAGAGAFKAWTAGGITTSVASPAPTGFTYSYQMALASATLAAHWRRTLSVPAGAKAKMTFYLRKDASMTYLPRVWVYEAGYEPFLDATKIVHAFTMTDSTNTWESETYEYENAAAYDQLIEVRFVGKSASGSVYSLLDVESGGSGGAVRILPIGKVGL